MSLVRLSLRPLACSLLVLAFAAGCRPQDEIARYTVPKPELIDPTLVSAPAIEQQMLGAIVLVENAGWFFKLTGPKEQISPLAKPFEAFVSSVEFHGEPVRQPQWKLPEGWKQLPASQFRFATLEIPAPGKPLELAVSTLEKSSGDNEAYVLANVNRWRGQLGLDEVSASELATTTTATKVGDYDATLVNLTGTSTGAAPRGPFSSGGPFASTAAPPLAPAATASAASEGKPKFSKPEGWTEMPPKTFGLAAFAAGDGDKRVEITISSAGGDMAANVNRWRGQVGLPPIAAAEVSKALMKIETLGVEGNYVELTGPGPSTAPKPTSILGVAATVGDRQYFVKLMGDPAVATREKSNFELFVKSLKLE